MLNRTREESQHRINSSNDRQTQIPCGVEVMDSQTYQNVCVALVAEWTPATNHLFCRVHTLICDLTSQESGSLVAEKCVNDIEVGSVTTPSAEECLIS